MKNQNKFNCFQEIIFEKSKDEKTGAINYKFKSAASDGSIDADGEEIQPDGVETKDFLSHGFINYNHLLKSSPKALIGEPTKAYVQDNKLMVEGILYGDSKLARDIIETDELLRKSGSTRKIGISIEGIPLKRNSINPKRIEKARLTGAAFTLTPKNRNTWVELVKGEQSEDYIDYEFEKADPNGSISPEFLLDFTDKSKGVRVTMDKTLTIKISKALTTNCPSGRAIIPESMEKKPKNLFEFNKSLVVISEGRKLGLVGDKIFEKTKNKLNNLVV